MTGSWSRRSPVAAISARASAWAQARTHGQASSRGALLATMLATVLAAGACTDARAPAAVPAARTPAGRSGFFLTEEQRARIHTVTVAPAVFRSTIATTGTVAFNADRSTPVLSQISGPVAQILVTLGTTVQAGAPLATVTSADFAQAVAAYQKAQTALHNATRIATLDAQLFKNDAIARSELDQARSDSASAWADREAAVQQMVALGVDSAAINAIREGRPVPPTPGVIRSPIAGVVVERLINPGQVLQAGQTQAFTIADLSTMWVMANVFESNLAAVGKGETALVTTDAWPDTLRGRVDYVAALVDTATRATAVRVVVPNKRQILKRDMYVKVAIESAAPRTGLLVPVSAVLRDEQNLPFVFVAASDGGFGRRSVTLGSRIGDRYEVTDGLRAGDQVVSEGALFIQFAESQ